MGHARPAGYLQGRDRGAAPKKYRHRPRVAFLAIGASHAAIARPNHSVPPPQERSRPAGQRRCQHRGWAALVALRSTRSEAIERNLCPYRPRVKVRAAAQRICRQTAQTALFVPRLYWQIACAWRRIPHHVARGIPTRRPPTAHDRHHAAVAFGRAQLVRAHCSKMCRLWTNLVGANCLLKILTSNAGWISFALGPPMSSRIRCRGRA